MNIIYIIIPIALFLGGAFVVAFLVSVKKGQYDDLETPAHRILFAENFAENTESQKNTLEKSIREGALNGK